MGVSMSVTFLNVPYSEKDEAKALGARWNPQVRKWYVPAGIDLALFTPWLPEGLSIDLVTSDTEQSISEKALSKKQGITLSQLLSGVVKAVNSAFRYGVWTLVEVVQAQQRNGHVFLELSERNQYGNVIAQARAVMWANVANEVLPRFEKETGAVLAPGIKLLAQAKPSFHTQYGFSLFIEDIDPQYTLGDLEAKKKEIINRLKQEQIFLLNKQLPSPWDYNCILVISPKDAAGLGDFQAEALRLQNLNLCDFIYIYCRFQGEGAADEIRQALQEGVKKAAQAEKHLDAIVIIRGGGAVNDLAWLNDYFLAKAICLINIPVFTGIGHERDNTVLDQVAHMRFDTPSKVIAGIEQGIFQRVLQLKGYFDEVKKSAAQQLSVWHLRIEQDISNIQKNATQVLTGSRDHLNQLIYNIQYQAQQQKNHARSRIPSLITYIQLQSNLMLQHARNKTNQQHQSVLERSQYCVQTYRKQVFQYQSFIFFELQQQKRSVKKDIKEQYRAIFNESKRSLIMAKNASVALFREITGQGPKKTLARGFALVRDHQGQVITHPAKVNPEEKIQVQFDKGTLDARVIAVKGVQSDDTKNV